MCIQTGGLLTQNPLDQRVSIFGCQRAAAIRRQRHCHVAPVGLPAESQLVLEHYAGVWHVAITIRNLLKRRSEKRCVPCLGLHAREAFEVNNRDLLATRIDQTVFLKLRKHAADGFEFHPEVAADLLARHAQIEFCRRVAARLEPS
jgi:hypothetical protein